MLPGIQITATTVTATATVLYATIIFAQFVWRERFQQPKLEIEYEPEADPDLHQSTQTVFMPTGDGERKPVDRHYHRLKVENSGRAAAKNCRTRLRIREHPGDRDAPTTEPKSLHWTGLEAGEYEDIPPKSEDLGILDLLFTQEGLPDFENEGWGPVRARLATHRGIRQARTEDISIRDGLPEGTYEFSIQVFPENGAPSNPVRLKIDIGTGFEDVEIEKVEE